MPDDFDNFDPFEELAAAERRLAETEGRNVWGRPMPPKDEEFRQAAADQPRGGPSMAKRVVLTPDQLKDFRANYNSKPADVWAKLYGVSKGTIWYWAHRNGLTRQSNRSLITRKPVGRTRPAAIAAKAEQLPDVLVCKPDVRVETAIASGEAIVRLRIRIEKVAVDVIDD